MIINGFSILIIVTVAMVSFFFGRYDGKCSLQHHIMHKLDVIDNTLYDAFKKSKAMNFETYTRCCSILYTIGETLNGK
jgi:hypothetical protein